MSYMPTLSIVASAIQHASSCQQGVAGSCSNSSSDVCIYGHDLMRSEHIPRLRRALIVLRF